MEKFFENFDWSAFFAGLAVFLSFLGLKFQRNDIIRQNKYQRDTFELQNKIDTNNKIIDVSALLLQLIDQQYKCTSLIMKKKVEIKMLTENKLYVVSPQHSEEGKKLYKELSVLKSNLSTLKTEYSATKNTLEMLIKLFGDQRLIKEYLINIERCLDGLYKAEDNSKSDEQKVKNNKILEKTKQEIGDNIIKYRGKIDEIQNDIFLNIERLKNS
ncbi:hypothetical protein [Lactococcus petauri]|uniref:hypothetical protein n=1 Tax=Lactococcus petauri TaxID=1940789 RepID=UPI0021D510D2|nr:hypothetical protein [Lactococcus petauri]MCU7363666.1 hypothetical protein [Lactococcus petauri]MDA3734934.1 hypothetical protein [Lactococcus petauri]MDC7842312.1 hypothetical protein [Lactococcus petauri]